MGLQDSYPDFQEDYFVGQMLDVGDPPRVARGEAVLACKPGDLVQRGSAGGGRWTTTLTSNLETGVIVYDHRKRQAADGTIDYAPGDEIQICLRGTIVSSHSGPGSAVAEGAKLTGATSAGVLTTAANPSAILPGLRNHKAIGANATNVVVQLTNEVA